jgi:Domain of unknown function (DUF4129)
MVTAGGGPVGGAAAKRAAQDELSRREYHRDDPGLVARALHWLGHRINDVFTGAGGGASHALLIVLVVLLAGAILLAVRAGVPSRSRRGLPAGGSDPLAPIAARDHRRIAAQLATEGRRAEALREWLRAAVATIEERGLLPHRPGRTGATTAREAGQLLPDAAGDLRAATAAFDEVWFGGREATDDDVARARAAADLVQSARVAPGVAAAEGIAVPW